MNEIRPWPLVKEGVSLHPVETVQYLLRERGHDVSVDGVFGPQTADAVREVQTRLALTVDGVVGPQTWQALIVTVRARASRRSTKMTCNLLSLFDAASTAPSP